MSRIRMRLWRRVICFAICAIPLTVAGLSHHNGDIFRVDANAHAEDGRESTSSKCSPIDLVLTSDESRIITVNQSANTISLIDLNVGKTLDEVACGHRPSNVALTPDGKHVLATATNSGELIVYALLSDTLRHVGSVKLSFEPRGVAISADGKLAYVALTTAAEVAVVDVEKLTVVDRIAVGRWPRYLALSPDGTRLAVGCNGDGGVAVVDTASRKQLYLESFAGLNLGHMQVSADGTQVYFPWIVYRHNPITAENIRRGWVLASRIARVRLDGKTRREAISLDPRGQAVGDPHGLALSPDEQTLVCTASGTHELLIYKVPGMPFQDYGGPGDHVDPKLLLDRKLFDRIPLGGRPMAVRYSKDGKKVFVANSLLNSIQEVDIENRKVMRTIELRSQSAPTLAQQGEAIFYDAGRSLDQWYSCHSCHYEGHTNAVTMDTKNDGRFGNFKTVLSLRGAPKTGPWFWHGWEPDFRAAVKKSMTDTMMGKAPEDRDVEAVVAYIETLTPSPNPNLESGRLSESAARGEVVFRSAKAGCATCHPAPNFADATTHDVGLGSEDDVYERYSAPSLRGVYDRLLFLHDGRSRSLKELLTGPHNPSSVTGKGELSAEELQDLLAYLQSL